MEVTHTLSTEKRYDISEILVISSSKNKNKFQPTNRANDTVWHRHFRSTSPVLGWRF